MIKLKAFGYLRVSGKGQADGDGFERQRTAIEKHATANQIAIVEWFQDVQTGKDEWAERPGWSAMISAIDDIRTIIVEKLDRVARVVLIQELIVADLAKREVTLLTSAGDDTSDDQPERVLLRHVLSAFAHFERSMITLKLRGARQRKKAAEGRCEGRKPFGMKAGESPVLSQMKRLRASGLSFTDVAAKLNEAGNLSRYSKPWIAATICKILEREQQEGFVYVVEYFPLLRIGFSCDPPRRVKELELDVPRNIAVKSMLPVLIATIPGNMAKELTIHRALRKFLYTGSWYVDCADLRSELMAVGFDITPSNRPFKLPADEGPERFKNFWPDNDSSESIEP